MREPGQCHSLPSVASRGCRRGGTDKGRPVCRDPRNRKKTPAPWNPAPMRFRPRGSADRACLPQSLARSSTGLPATLRGSRHPRGHLRSKPAASIRRNRNLSEPATAIKPSKNVLDVRAIWRLRRVGLRIGGRDGDHGQKAKSAGRNRGGETRAKGNPRHAEMLSGASDCARFLNDGPGAHSGSDLRKARDRHSNYGRSQSIRQRFGRR